MNFVSNVLDAVPVVGHAKAAIHLIAGDKDGAGRASYQATRTSAVLLGGAVGSVAGPLGAAQGGILMGGFTDTVASITMNKNQGIVRDVENLETDIRTGRNCTQSLVMTGVHVLFDGVGGLSMSGHFGASVENASLTVATNIEEVIVEKSVEEVAKQVAVKSAETAVIRGASKSAETAAKRVVVKTAETAAKRVVVRTAETAAKKVVEKTAKKVVEKTAEIAGKKAIQKSLGYSLLAEHITFRGIVEGENTNERGVGDRRVDGRGVGNGRIVEKEVGDGRAVERVVERAVERVVERAVERVVERGVGDRRVAIETNNIARTNGNINIERSLDIAAA